MAAAWPPGDHSLLFLSRTDVVKVQPSVVETLTAVREVMLHKASGSVEIPPKTGLRMNDGSTFLHAMPAFVSGTRPLAGVKWIAGVPTNRLRGLPYLTGLLVLNDTETGMPLAVMDASWITARRTAAVSALAANLLGRPGSKVASIIGTGVQARCHLEALPSVLDVLEEIRVFNPKPDATARFVAELQPTVPSLRLIGVSSVEKAVTDADLVISVTSYRTQHDAGIQAAWLKAGVLGLPVDLAIWAGLTRFIDLLFVDDIAEYDRYRAEGRFPEAPPVSGELAQVLTDRSLGRRTQGERIVVMTVGLAICDIAIAALVYDRALQLGVGTKLQP